MRGLNCVYCTKMKNLCEIGTQIAREFDLTEDIVCSMIRSQTTRNDCGAPFVSLFEDPHFIEQEREIYAIWGTLKAPRIAEIMFADQFSQRQVEYIIQEACLLGEVIEIFQKAVESFPSAISRGFEQLIHNILTVCVKQKLGHDIIKITRACVFWKTSPDCNQRCQKTVILGLIHSSRYIDMSNENERTTIIECVRMLLNNALIVDVIRHSYIHPSMLIRWESICREYRILN